MVLNRYLSELSHYPAQLAALFGVKTLLSEASAAPAKSYEQEQIIEAFGLRVEEEFISFRLNPLADNTLPAKIELGKVEKQAFAYEKWLNTKVKLKSMATEHIDNVDSDIIDKWLEEAKSRNIAQSQREYWFYLIGRLIAENNEWDYFKLLEQWWQKTHYSNTNLLETLMNHLIDIENNNNDS
ncbi:hypothetical protein [Aggregatibacter actinomycetemcomitans]|uniref:hypothetical protein n=1 Tax=Aggregatibacter actinomycetemcomitans TaxID=714 RepID=UPI00352B5B62